MKSNTHTYTHRKTERESDDGQREWKMYDQILQLADPWSIVVSMIQCNPCLLKFSVNQLLAEFDPSLDALRLSRCRKTGLLRWRRLTSVERGPPGWARGNMPITRLNIVLSPMIVRPKIYWRRNDTAVCTGAMLLHPCAPGASGYVNPGRFIFYFCESAGLIVA